MSETVTIERLVAGGWGLARTGHHVTFVRGVLPGERVMLHEQQPHQGYQFASVQQVLHGSADRVVPACPLYARCGGCHLQHVRYPSQLLHKRNYLFETLRRIGKMDPAVPCVVHPSTKQRAYRSWVRFKVRVHAGKWRLGFFQERSHEFIEATSCLLMAEAMKPLVDRISTFLAMQRLPLHVLDELEIRLSSSRQEFLIILRGLSATRVEAERFLDSMVEWPSVRGVVFQGRERRAGNGVRRGRLVRGEESLEEEFHGLTVRISDRSFMQSNWPMFEIIGNRLVSWLEGRSGSRVLELFAGTGCLGLVLAKDSMSVTGIESNPIAVADARISARRNNISTIRFRGQRIEEYLPSVGPKDVDCVIADPPREGLSVQATQELLRLRVPRLVYLSCDVASLARDLYRLVQGGYAVVRMEAFDMFPQTAHLETLVELNR